MGQALSDMAASFKKDAAVTGAPSTAACQPSPNSCLPLSPTSRFPPRRSGRLPCTSSVSSDGDGGRTDIRTAGKVTSGTTDAKTSGQRHRFRSRATQLPVYDFILGREDL